MKKLFYLFNSLGIILLLNSCTVQQKPLTPVSSETIIVESKLPKDKVWEKLVDYMATKGFNIKIIDKQSGLVLSEDYSFANSQTHADKKGEILNPLAYVIIRDGKNADYVTGQANVRVKENPNGGSIINVNIVNLRAHSVSYSYGGMYNPKRETISHHPVASSQVFENFLAKQISE